jgi:hypothetical protein
MARCLAFTVASAAASALVDPSMVVMAYPL